ncbi:MAG: DNA polymerase II [Candidatus Woesearchaeota archaeon]
MAEKVKGFIIYPTYRIDDYKARVYLFGRLENGQSFLTINDYTPYFFIKKKDLKDAIEAVNVDFDHEDAGLKNFEGEPVVRIGVNVPRQVADLRKKFEEKNIICYEADIRFAYRYMIDNNLLGALEIEGEYTKGEFVDRVYDEPRITALNDPKHEFRPELKILSIDIETACTARTNPKAKLYSISLYSKDYKKVLIVSEKDSLKNCICFKNEKDLIVRFKDLVHQLDPDIITGWSVIDFDLKFLERKFKKYEIDFNLGRDEENCSLKISNDFFRASSADFNGRVVLDGLFLIKNSFIKLDDYKLDTAARELIGEKKLISKEQNKPEMIEHYFKEEPQKLADYNLNDSKLVYDILEKKNIIDLCIERELLTGMPMDRINASIATLDSLYLRELRKKGFVALSSAFGKKDKPITGGFVLSSKPGIYDYVIVCDFKSLYPSVIRTFNIDPLMFVKDCKGRDLVKAPNNVCFKKEKGILPGILQRLWEQRDRAKKRKDSIASHAIKIVMLSFWGSLASPNCRYFDWDLANAITNFSQHVIKLSMKRISELGYDVIYGDTDSVFIRLDADSVEECEKAGLKIQKDINQYLKKHVEEDYGMESCLELEFEKVYKRFLMPRIRKGDAGAKKRYAGLLVQGENEKIDITGLEFVRRDWTELSKKFQMELLDRIFHKQEVFIYIKKFVEDIKEGKHDELLVYKKAIRKSLDEYTKTTPPHVKAARKMNEVISNLIEYIVTVNGPEPVGEIKSRIDYDHYIDKQIKPIADSVLSFYNQSFDDIIKGSTQKGLFDY